MVIGMGWRPEGGIVDLVNAIVARFAIEPPFPVPPPSSSSSSPPRSNSPYLPTSQQQSLAVSPSQNKREQLAQLLQPVYDERFKTLNQKVEDLLTQSTLLCENNRLLREEKEQRLRQKETLEAEIQRIQDFKEKIIELAQISGPLPAEELAKPEGPISTQLFHLTAEDLAYQDTIYSLSTAFNEGKTSLDLAVYLKTIRDLARKQFMARALRVKIRTKYPIIHN